MRSTIPLTTRTISGEETERLFNPLVELHGWLLYGDDPITGELIEAEIIQRTIAAAYVVRRDALKGKRLDRIAAEYGWTPERLHGLASGFAARFRLPYADLAEAMRRSTHIR